MTTNTKNIKQIIKANFIYILLFALILTPLNFAFSFAYIFAGESNGVDVVSHPRGYTGAGGTVSVTVGVDPTSPFASDMLVSTQNVINTFNGLQSTSPNLNFITIPSNNVDFESVLLHELGHSLGLAHCNAATESGLASNLQDFTKSTDGLNNVFNTGIGSDGIIGSEDDIRGDDVNLNYFKISDNNPFTLSPTVVDQTTYSRDLADLPSGVFSANGDRDVAISLGSNRTESVMNQGSGNGEIQRTLAADDVAAIRYGFSGVDEIEGTADDYDLVLNYVGLSNTADIVIKFDNSETGFAVSQNGGTFVGPDHVTLAASRIFFNTNFQWFFNQTLSVADNDFIDANLFIYPNPASNTIVISNPKLLRLKTMEIYDINGRLIMSNKLDGNLFDQTELDISAMSNGVYLLVIDAEEGQFTKQIIKD